MVLKKQKINKNCSLRFDYVQVSSSIDVSIVNDKTHDEIAYLFRVAYKDEFYGDEQKCLEEAANKANEVLNLIRCTTQ